MKTVWVIFEGEDHEGGGIIAIYSNKKQAIENFSLYAQVFIKSLDHSKPDTIEWNYVHIGCTYIQLDEVPIDVNFSEEK